MKGKWIYMEEKTEELTNKIVELEKELQDKIAEYDNKINARYDEIQQEGGDAYIDEEYNQLNQQREDMIKDFTQQINQLYSELEVNETARENEENERKAFEEDKAKRIDEISKKIDDRLQTLYELGDSNVYLDEELANLRLELDKIKEEKFVSSRELAEKEQEEKNRQEEERRNKEILSARKEYNEIKQQKQDLEQEIKVDEENLENNSLFKEREALKAEIENLQKKGIGQDDPEYQEYMNDIEKISAELEQLTAKIDEKKARLEQCNIRISELENQYGDKLIEQVQPVQQDNGLEQQQDELEEREIPGEEDLMLNIPNTSESIYERLSDDDKKDIMKIDVYNIDDENKYIKVLGLENNSVAYKFLLLSKLQDMIKERDLDLLNSQQQANDYEPKIPQRITRTTNHIQPQVRPTTQQQSTTTTNNTTTPKQTLSIKKPKKEISFSYQVSAKGIFYNGIKQDETLLNEFAENNNLEDILEFVMDELAAEDLLQYGDKYIILSILSNGKSQDFRITEEAKANLRNYYKTLLDNTKSDKVKISYDLRGTTWFSKLIGKCQLSPEYLEYAQILAYDNRKIADVKTGPITGMIYKFKDFVSNLNTKRISAGNNQQSMQEPEQPKAKQQVATKSWELSPEDRAKANSPTVGTRDTEKTTRVKDTDLQI